MNGMEKADSKNALTRLSDVEDKAASTSGRLEDFRSEVRIDLDYLATQLGVDLPSHAPRPKVMEGRG